MLWIALHCPTLPLDRIERRFPAALVPAMAVPARKGNQASIQHANRRARQHGITAQQTLASALSIFPDLVIVEQDLNEEMKTLREAAHAALRFTPNIAMRASGLIAEVSASLKLFGGLKKLCPSLNRAVATQGLQLCTGVAPTATGAWLLAQSAAPQTVVNGAGSRFGNLLDSVPAHLLESAQPHLEVIHGIGCRTLADLRRLPRAGIARRFGPDLAVELDRAYGELPDPQQWLEIPEHFQQRLKLMALVENVELLLVPAQRMIEQMCGWLASRHAAVLAFAFTLHHEHSLRQQHKLSSISIRLCERSADPAHLMLLLRERLDRTEAIAPICEVELAAEEITADANASLELFPTAQSETTSLNRFIEKLSSRLGPQAITRLSPVPDHRPECSQRPRSPEMGKGKEKSVVRLETHPGAAPEELLRPAWLLDAPLELKQKNRQPVYGSPLELIAGPERIEAGWWDDGQVARDYFIAKNELGQLLWIYRRHAPAEKPGDDENGKSWYLQGLFG